MRYITFLFFTVIIVLITMLLGCGMLTRPVFYNTASTELQQLSETLTNTRLEDLFRSYPTLKLVKSTEIGNDKMRHEFSYVAIERENYSVRPAGTSHYGIWQRRITYSINIFVDASGVIYEVLQPVRNNVEYVQTSEYP